MGHAITVSDVLIVAGVGVGMLVLVGGIFGLIWLLNPFRSGH
jgi:hypothetical protein